MFSREIEINYRKLLVQRMTAVGRWIHRFRRTRQMMSDVHPGPDAGFLERYGDHQQERRRDIGWKAFLCRQHCHGQLVVDTTQKGHYRVRIVVHFKNLSVHNLFPLSLRTNQSGWA